MTVLTKEEFNKLVDKFNANNGFDDSEYNSVEESSFASVDQVVERKEDGAD